MKARCSACVSVSCSYRACFVTVSCPSRACLVPVSCSCLVPGCRLMVRATTPTTTTTTTTKTAPTTTTTLTTTTTTSTATWLPLFYSRVALERTGRPSFRVPSFSILCPLPPSFLLPPLSSLSLLPVPSAYPPSMLPSALWLPLSPLITLHSPRSPRCSFPFLLSPRPCLFSAHPISCHHSLSLSLSPMSPVVSSFNLCIDAITEKPATCTCISETKIWVS
jgi:hypothetical protein